MDSAEVVRSMNRLLTRPHVLLIAIVGVIVPRRLRADWREEWETELRYREELLAEWDRLGWRSRWELLRRSSGAFWDALWLQRQRLEDDVVQDFRFGVRMLVKSPAFTLVAVLTLALGIGANTAIFSVVNALLLRPLDGVSDPGRLVQLGRQYANRTSLSDSSHPDFVDYRAGNTTMSGLAAMSPTAFHLSARGVTERLEGELVTGDYFSVLGVTPIQGRLITPDDDRDDGSHLVCVISSRLWHRRFDGDARIVGSTVTLDARPFTVIGVASEPFAGIKIGTPRDIWVPLTTLRLTNPSSAHFGQRRASWLEMFGRLKPGVTLAQARTEFSLIAAHLERTYPDTNASAGVRLEPGLGRDVDFTSVLRRFTYIPFAAVGIVLLIACVNVAGLLLARASTRHREIATRLALGAGRTRVVRQLLTESLTLALVGGVAGLVLGAWLTTWLRSLLPERFLFFSFDVDFGLDWRVLGFTIAISTVTGVLFGIAPACRTSRPDLSGVMKGSPVSSYRRGGLRAALVVSEVALSVILLVAAGLCVKTLQNAEGIDFGYQAARVLTARIDLRKQGYERDRGRIFQQQLLDRLSATPGVDSAALAITLPLNDGRWEDAVRRQDDPTRFQTFQNIVSPEYFRVMSVSLMMGRGFSARDDTQTPQVAILNQTLARMMWPNENPLGKRVTFDRQSLEVIGIARDAKGRNPLEAPGPMLYRSLLQQYQPATVLHLRTALPPEQFGETVRREVSNLDKDLPVYALTPLQEHVTASLTPQRLLAHLTTAFGLLALLLAGIGLYGLLAYTVTERTAEIGVRMALGAHRGDVVRLFVAGGMKLALAGVGLGLLAAAAVMPLIKSVLFGVSPLDPLTLVTASVVLVSAALIACYIPARRAADADPKIALRYE